jgi:NADH-quinone oxidoreductase subunit J
MILDFVFFLFAAGAVIGSILMVTRRNPVASAIFLIAVFFCISALFLLMEAHFIAVLNVILYAGAIMVLFIFVIMLLNLGHAEWRDLRGPVGGLVVGSIAVAFLGVMTRFLLGGGEPVIGGTPAGDAFQAAAAEQGVVKVVAEPLFRDYIVPFEIAGLLLLVAIVGTILLARRETP